MSKKINDKIIVKGARMHNLKNIDIEIPKNKLTVITGLSGSGKSTLAFDTIYAEGQRRYVESLSTYARNFLQLMEKPEVDSIEGLSPAISIDQKAVSRNPRSTVGTVTEIYDYLRLLYAKVGTPHCPKCGDPIEKQTKQNIVEKVTKMEEGKKILVLAPIVNDMKGQHLKAVDRVRRDGFVRLRIDGEVYTITDIPELDENKKHTIEIVVDRLVIKDLEKKSKTLSSGQVIDLPNPSRSRLSDSIETALKYGEGFMTIADHGGGEDIMFSEHFACVKCDVSIPEIEPRSFSFNSPHGACHECHGLGSKLEVDPALVMPNKDLTLAEGAIVPWSATSANVTWFSRLLESVAKAHKFSLNTPVRKLSKKVIDLLLYGDKSQKFTVTSQENGRSYEANFEGVVQNLERRYRETESEYVSKKIQEYMRVSECSECHGQRLKKEMLAVTVADLSIIEITQMSVEKAIIFFDNMELSKMKMMIADSIIGEIKDRLLFLNDVGLSYLSIDRAANTLSGGEAQRIRLATQIGAKLSGVIYVLDEPSIGLHQNDNDKLIKTMESLRDLGNTVIVVEHDIDTMLAADYLIDIGPGAGVHGGAVVAAGTPKEVMANHNSVTGKYLSGEKKVPMPTKRREGNGKSIVVHGATEHNLKNITVEFPLGKFIGVSGVSGSGKSTLVNGILMKVIATTLNGGKRVPGRHEKVTGVEHVDKIINIDQSPIGRTPRSNPATYTGVFTDIRELFSKTTEAKLRGYKTGRFSFNVKGGRCEACSGDGVKRIAMHFLPDIFVPCESCHGKRYNDEALEILYRGKNIYEVLEMTIEEALEFFSAIPRIKAKLKTLTEVGLGYIKLGQSAVTLSGGEAQRVKLATELSKRSTGKTIYILDEPTTGLHFDDVKLLLDVLNRLVDGGNTVLVIEHNLDVIKGVDHVIDMGLNGGDGGGTVLAQGTPEDIMSEKRSYTGQWLKKML